MLFNIDDESNRALTTLIKKLEVEKFERDLLIENLQVIKPSEHPSPTKKKITSFILINS